jgi:hypothetical protein
VPLDATVVRPTTTSDSHPEDAVVGRPRLRDLNYLGFATAPEGRYRLRIGVCLMNARPDARCCSSVGPARGGQQRPIGYMRQMRLSPIVVRRLMVEVRQ